MSQTALTIGQGRLDNQVYVFRDGREIDLGMPGTRHHARRLRKLIRHRLKHEEEFKAAFGHQFTRRGRSRA